MRLILDLQACQSGSRFRGIGRYSWSLANNMIGMAKAGGHDIWVVLNASFPQQAQEVRAALNGQVDERQILSFRVPTPCAANEPTNAWRHRAAELLREHAIARLAPDFLHVSTMLADCWVDDSIASVGELPVHIPTALTHYDLIPLVMEAEYLSAGPYRTDYLRKLESVKRADLLLAISQYTKQEAAEYLGRNDESVVNISAALDDDFGSTAVTADAVMTKYGVRPGFLLYAPGGFDPRKNLNRLIEAYGSLDPVLRQGHQLVIASKLGKGEKEAWLWKAGDSGLAPGEFILTDYVPDNDLMGLYSACHAYVFPSLHEGFGLPILEAMSFGVAVVASNRTSVPEAVGLEEALFDPTSVNDIAATLKKLLVDDAFVARLRAHAKVQVKKFSWGQSAAVALDAMVRMHAARVADGQVPASLQALPDRTAMLDQLGHECQGAIASETDIDQFNECYEKNCEVFNP